MKKVQSKQIRLMTIVGCTFLGLVSCKQAPNAAMQSSSYETMTVTTADKELSTSYSATIRGRQDIDIYPQVSGTIVRLCVTEGEAVRQGQLLFIIDQVPYKAALKTAEANVATARASLATAELNYGSQKELYAQKVVSEFSLKTAQNNYLTAKAQLAQAEAQEVNARNNLSYTEVKSPSNGVVGALPYRVGALVSSRRERSNPSVVSSTARRVRSLHVPFSQTNHVCCTVEPPAVYLFPVSTRIVLSSRREQPYRCRTNIWCIR